MIYYFNYGVQFTAVIDIGMRINPVRWLANRQTHSQAKVLGDYTYYQRDKKYKVWVIEETL